MNKPDRDVFKQLFDRYFKNLRNYLYYRCGDAELATDIAQEVFMRVWEKQLVVDADKAMPLLIKMGNDMVISDYRKRMSGVKFRNSIVLNGQSHSPEEVMVYNQLQDRYESALAQMNEGQRVVYLMSRSDGLKYAEIAQQLGLSVKAVEKRMSLALDYLREQLG